MTQRTTPFTRQFKADQTFRINSEGSAFRVGDLVVLDQDDGSEWPYFRRPSDGAIGCCWVDRLEVVESKEVTPNQSEE